MHIDLTNKTFGKLTVIQIDHKQFYPKRRCHVIFWKCLCECGNEKVVRDYHLRSLHTTSCGCNRTIHIKKVRPITRPRYKTPEDYCKNELYRKYKSRTKRSFVIHKKEFCKLILASCHYCGSSPNNKLSTHGIVFRYNGVDRKDSSKGYTSDNVVSCCKRCNAAKNDMTIDEFKKWIHKVYHHFL